MKIKFHNLYTHYVLTTFLREPLIDEENRERIEKYITGIVNNNDSKLYAVYCNPEHTHILVSRSPKLSEQQLATIIANSTEKYINKNKLSSKLFKWQQTASAFSVSKSDVDRICKYILNQKEHHRKVNYEEEYNSLLKHYQQTLKFNEK